MNAVIICIVVCVCSMEGTDAYRYPDADSLRSAVYDMCCNSKKRALSSLTGDVDGHRSLIAKPESDVALSVREDGNGDNNIPNDIPSASKIQAKSFILYKRVTVRGLREECCLEGCYNEEVKAGAWYQADTLGEECLVEGCDKHEIWEHCW